MKKLVLLTLDERNTIDALTQEEKDLGDFLMGIFLE